MTILTLVVLVLAGCKNDNENEPQPTPDGSTTTIELKTNYLDISREATEEEIGLKASADWNVLNAAESWISVSPTKGSKGNNLTLKLAINENDGAGERTGKIVVKATSGNTADTLTVRQAGVTPYVAIDWEKDATLSQFDITSGKVTISFKDRAPDFQKGISAIVIPTDSLSYIRVVNDVAANGNSITLQTEAGDMTDIFMNQEFTLSTVPATKTFTTRSSQVNTTDKNGLIHPTQISTVMEDGQRVILYDAETNVPQTRGDADEAIKDARFFYWGKDFSGEKIFQKGGATLQWDKCLFEAAIDGKFYFNFGPKVEINNFGVEVPKGELLGFFYLLEGSVDIDLLLHLIAETKYSGGTEEPTMLMPHVLGVKGLDIKFMIGTVPVIVNVNADLKAETSFQSHSRGDLTGGLNTGITAKIGVNYFEGQGAKAIDPQIKPYFNLYKPEIKVKGNIDANVTVYPDIRIRFYNFAGANVQFKPLIGDEITYGGRDGGEEENYAAWTNRIYQQLDITGNLALGFANIDAWQSQPIRLGGTDQKDLYRTPDDIEIINPAKDEDKIYKENEPITVTVRTTAFSIFENMPPTVGAVVKFESVNGSLSQEYALTNANGEATVTWTPLKKGAVLTAKITDADGKTIASDNFAPQFKEDEFSLVGTWKREWRLVSIEPPVTENITDILIFNKDNTFSFVLNPEQKKLIRNMEDLQHIIYPYGICNGRYIYNKWSSSWGNINFSNTNLIDKSTETTITPNRTEESKMENWPDIDLLHYIFGRDGANEIKWIDANNINIRYKKNNHEYNIYNFTKISKQ